MTPVVGKPARPILAQALVPAFVVLFSCKQDINITQSAQCDGDLQSQEGDVVDAPFDKDGDGYFDGNNPDCVATYIDNLDCDDADPSIHPNAEEIPCDDIDQDCDPETTDAPDLDGDGWDACDDCDDTLSTVYPTAPEIECDGIDNDCNEATPDSQDADGDAWSSCDDCDDSDPAISPSANEIACNDVDDDCDASTPDSVDEDEDSYSDCEDCDDDEATTYPDAEEICDDEIDNDCDDEIDEECTADYSGDWVLDDTISIRCGEFWGLYMVEFSFNVLEISDYNPSIQIEPSPGGATQPGTLIGDMTEESDGTMSVDTENALVGGCTEVYGIEGSFSDTETMVGTFSATYVGSQCLDCASTSTLFTATRN